MIDCSKKKTPIFDSSDDSELEKSGIAGEKRKKTTFFASDSDIIPNSKPKYKQIVCYKTQKVR